MSAREGAASKPAAPRAAWLDCRPENWRPVSRRVEGSRKAERCVRKRCPVGGRIGTDEADLRPAGRDRRTPAGRRDDRPVAPPAGPLSQCRDRLARPLGERRPDRVFVAERRDGVWRKVTYAEAREVARRIAQGIVERGLSTERPVAILSGNSVEHALFGLGAMIAGVPYAPVSPPYSLVAKDFGKLKTILGILTPGLVYVSDGTQFALALEAGVPKDVEVVAGVNPPQGRPSTTLRSLRSQARRSRGRRGAGEGRPRHGRQTPVHLRLDRRAQGRDQHPAG